VEVAGFLQTLNVSGGGRVTHSVPKKPVQKEQAFLFIYTDMKFLKTFEDYKVLEDKETIAHFNVNLDWLLGMLIRIECEKQNIIFDKIMPKGNKTWCVYFELTKSKEINYNAFKEKIEEYIKSNSWDAEMIIKSYGAVIGVNRYSFTFELRDKEPEVNLESHYFKVDTTCADCGNRSEDYYVQDALWYKTIPSYKQRNHICLRCFEKQLGRKLTMADFKGPLIPVRDQWLIDVRDKWLSKI
jgi:hypothetical protein